MPQQEIASAGRFSLSDWKEIVGGPGPCITVILQVHPSGDLEYEDSLRLKKAIQSVEEALQARGANAATVRSILEPLRAFEQEFDAGPRPGASLALLRSPEVFRSFYLASRLEDCVEIGDHFYIRPLLNYLTQDHKFYILALSQNHVRLLRCTDHSSEEVQMPDSFPASFDVWMNSVKPDHTLDNRVTGGPSVGSGPGAMFGTGTEREDKDKYLLHFYKEVSKRLQEVLKDETAPLVAAGVEYELPLYHKVNQYSHLVEGGVHGAPDGLKGGELHKRALEIVEPVFSAELERALVLFEKQAGSERVSTDPKEVVKAAHDGRVAFLFVADEARLRGNFVEATHNVYTHTNPAPGDEELLNAAAAETLLNSGQVFSIPAERVPGGGPVAAVLRY